MHSREQERLKALTTACNSGKAGSFLQWKFPDDPNVKSDFCLNALWVGEAAPPTTSCLLHAWTTGDKLVSTNPGVEGLLVGIPCVPFGLAGANSKHSSMWHTRQGAFSPFFFFPPPLFFFFSSPPLHFNNWTQQLLRVMRDFYSAVAWWRDLVFIVQPGISVLTQRQWCYLTGALKA